PRPPAARGLARLGVRRREAVEDARRIPDRLAPEPLSLQPAPPRRAAARLRSYGSLFLGGASAVALGDYITGPNHILPTAGAARHTGGLSVHRFLQILTVQ